MKFEEYFREGLLIRCKIDKDKIKGSLKLAERFLERAKGNLKMGYFDIAFILAYNSMFHSARALLFSFGVKERSHFAMIEFLKQKLKENERIFNFLKILDSYRISRHAIQYRGDLCSKTDAEEAIRDAEEFLKLIKKHFTKKLPG
jgi:uncharacterized protein (UPF0332 family)